MRAFTNMEEKVLDEIKPSLRMNHFWMELESINSFLRLFNGGMRSILRMSDGVKSRRQGLYVISVAHPDHELTALSPEPLE
jgi:hypothetical protein